MNASPACQLFVEFLGLQIEHGSKNGELNATWRALEKFGINYNLIKSTIQEAVDLRIVEITSPKNAHRTTFKLLR